MSRQLVTVTEDQIERAQRMLYNVPGGANKALARAINRATQNARSNVVRHIRDEYTVKATDVRRTLSVTRATASNLEAEINSKGAVIPLSSFKVRPATVNGRRRTPIRVSVRKGNVQSLDRSFIARLGGGKPNVFERVGQRRLPIRKLHGPSVAQMMGNDRVIDRISQDATDMMDKRLEHEIGRLLEGAN